MYYYSFHLGIGHNIVVGDLLKGLETKQAFGNLTKKLSKLDSDGEPLNPPLSKPAMERVSTCTCRLLVHYFIKVPLFRYIVVLHTRRLLLKSANGCLLCRKTGRYVFSALC